MKLLKIRVRNYPDGKMKYPDNFLNIQCLEHIYCDDIINNICYLVVAIKDEDLLKIKDMSDVQELTEQEAETFTVNYDKGGINPTLGIEEVKFIDKVKKRNKNL